MILVVFCFIFIYPVIFQSKLRIHDSLALFTKISLRDVDYYSEHYKKILLYLT